MEKSAIVISIYPKQGTAYDKSVGGAAHYIKQILSSLKDWRFTVLAESYGGTVEEYNEENVTIKRCWNSNSFLYWISLVKEIAKRKEKLILINFEFNVFGGRINTLTFFFVILSSFLLGKKIVFIQHQVVGNISDLQVHLNLSTNPIYLLFLDIGIRIYMACCFALSTKIVVFEEVLKERADKLLFIHPHKVAVIPHPIYSRHSEVETSNSVAGTQDEFSLLYFGFVTWYKGADWLVEKTLNENWDKNIKVHIAGGISVTAPSKNFYENFLNLVKSSQVTSHYGYVEEEDVPKHINKSDLMVLPYRVLMSSSGPLATALGYKKPFIISEVLWPYSKTQDFSDAMNEAGISKADLVFSLNDTSFESLLHAIKSEKSKHDKIARFVSILSEKRSLHNISNLYDQLLTENLT